MMSSGLWIDGRAFAEAAGDDLEAGAVQCLGYRRELGHHVFAIATLLNHRDHAGELALGPTQPVEDLGDVVLITQHTVASFRSSDTSGGISNP